MIGKGIPFAQLTKPTIVNLTLDELRKVRLEEAIRSVGITFPIQQCRYPIEQTPRRLDEETQVMYPRRSREAVVIERVVAEEVRSPEDKLISVVQDLRDEWHRAAEFLIYIAKVKEVQVDDLQLMAVGGRVVAVPAIAPLEGEDITTKLWTAVVVIAHLQARRG